MKTVLNMRSWLAAALGLAVAASAVRAEPAAPVAGAPAAKPTAGKKILLTGDSMMRLLSHVMEKELTKVSGAEAKSFTNLGTGLARLDAFDWMAKFDELMRDNKPDTVVVALGANDKQPMQCAGGKVVDPGAPEWSVEYAARTGQAMDRLIQGGAKCVIWLNLPDMRNEKHDAEAKEINRIVRAEAAKRPQVVCFDIGAVISRKPGTFTPYYMDNAGRPQLVRDPDGVHLARAGAEMVARALLKEFWGVAGN